MRYIKTTMHYCLIVSRQALRLSWVFMALFLIACSSTPKDSSKKSDGKNIDDSIPATSEGGIPAGFDVDAPNENPYLADKSDGPSGARSLFNNAISAMQQENWQRAEVLLQQLTTEYPKLSGPFLNLGIVYRKLDRQEDAETAFNNSIKANSLNLDAYNQLGLLLREEGRFGDAETQYKKAIAVWPKHAASHKNIGILYDLYMGDLNKALNHFEIFQYLQSEPDRQMAGWIIDLKRRIGN
ncbi:MAG: tetratricopeptide repeat protein [Cellvibrionaceae bacterium]